MPQPHLTYTRAAFQRDSTIAQIIGLEPDTLVDLTDLVLQPNTHLLKTSVFLVAASFLQAILSASSIKNGVYAADSFIASELNELLFQCAFSPNQEASLYTRTQPATGIVVTHKQMYQATIDIDNSILTLRPTPGQLVSTTTDFRDNRSSRTAHTP